MVLKREVANEQCRMFLGSFKKKYLNIECKSKLDCTRGICKLGPIYLTSNNSCQRYYQKRVFCTNWPCDLDLWPLDLKNIPAPEFVSMNTKFEHSDFICARVMVRTNTHTHSLLVQNPPPIMINHKVIHNYEFINSDVQVSWQRTKDCHDQL